MSDNTTDPAFWSELGRIYDSPYVVGAIGLVELSDGSVVFVDWKGRARRDVGGVELTIDEQTYSVRAWENGEVIGGSTWRTATLTGETVELICPVGLAGLLDRIRGEVHGR